jgi:choline dehydrogenase-like flavoprotein
MYNALLTARKLLSTASINPLKSSNNSNNKDILYKGTELLPSKLLVSSSKSFESYIKIFASPYFHACGTCAMPSSSSYKENNNDNHVVDEELKVIGIKKLRIADASVIPAISTGPTSAVCMAVGLACAELLIEAD